MNTLNGSEEPGMDSLLPDDVAWIIVRVALRQPWIARNVKNPILRKQCRLVGRNLRGSEDWQKCLQPKLTRLVQVLANKTKIWQEVPVRRHPIVPILVRLAAYEENWIRAPEDWQAPHDESAKAIMRSLLEHVLVRYDVPAFLYQAWQVRGDLRWRERDWFVQLAQGASWRDLQGLPRSISRSALHECRKAPDDLTIAQGLRWGQVLAANGTESLAREVVCSRMADDMSNDAYWSRLIAKFAAAGERRAASFGLVSDMFVEMFHQEHEDQVELLLKLPVRELHAYAKKFWSRVCVAVAVHLPEWKNIGIFHPSCRLQMSSLMRQRWRPLLPTSAQKKYVIRDGAIHLRELTSAAELIAEGRAMRHCVGSMTRSCSLNKWSILSLVIQQNGEEERLTLQVCRETREVKQMKGRWNREPSHFAWKCLEEWTRDNAWLVAS